MDAKTINGIIKRAVALFGLTERDAQTVRFSLLFAHDGKGRKVDLVRLASFGDADFAHDVGGIDRHASRAHESCGLLEGCFVPRCGFVEA